MTINASALHTEKVLAPEWIRRWGHSSSSISILDSTTEIFTLAGIEGMIGYRTYSDCVIVYGDPICAAKDVPALTEAFHYYCKGNGKTIIYLTVSKKFAYWALNHVGNALIEVGEDLIVDPQNDPSAGRAGKMLRKKVNHALREETVVHEYLSDDTQLRNKIEHATMSWLKGRQGPQIFLTQVHLFSDQMAGKRLFYAEKDGVIMGVALLYPLKAQQGWLLHFLMASPEAAPGTTELLVMSIIETLRKEDCSFLTLGTMQSPELGEIRGLGKFSVWLARSVTKWVRKVFHIDGKWLYLQKFLPKREPIYILFSEPRIRIKEIVGIMRSINVKL